MESWYRFRAFAAIKNAQPGDALDVLFSVQDVVKTAGRRRTQLYTEHKDLLKEIEVTREAVTHAQKERLAHIKGPQKKEVSAQKINEKQVYEERIRTLASTQLSELIEALGPGLKGRKILSDLIYKEETLAICFLHDRPEDYDVGFEEIEEHFDKRIAHSTRLITKKHRGTQVPYETYFGRMAEDPIASIVKAATRAHNIFTMNDANWTIEKQHAYMDEVSTWFLLMIKEVRRRFPQQEPAYENVKTLLNVQAAHIRLYLEHAVR